MLSETRVGNRVSADLNNAPVKCTQFIPAQGPMAVADAMKVSGPSSDFLPTV